MLSTIPVPFDHHEHRGGRVSFRKWADSTSGANLSPEPIFRYGRAFDDAIAQLRMLSESQESQEAVFLCNIVGHSSALLSRTELDTSTDLSFDYTNIESLINAPNVNGFSVDDNLLLDALSPLVGWQALCGVHSFDDSPQEAGLETVIEIPAFSKDRYAEGTVHCRLVDPAIFALNWRNISFPIYFIPPTTPIDVNVAADRFQRARLHRYLMRKKIPFSTLGECHMDDDIAVAYLAPSFDFPDTSRCFIR